MLDLSSEIFKKTTPLESCLELTEENALYNSIMISLNTNLRDPFQHSELGGWWANAFHPQDEIGSNLWKVSRRLSEDTLDQVLLCTEECLQWFKDKGTELKLEAHFEGSRLFLAIDCAKGARFLWEVPR